MRRAEIVANLADVRARIASACKRSGRAPSDITLIAVTKTRPVEDVRILRDLGILDVGENRDQEAQPKARAFDATDGRNLRWHFIGQLQSNKAKSVAQYAHMVHTVDRTSLAAALAKATPGPLDCLLQLSVDGDVARGGAVAADLLALADSLPSPLQLRGIMAVAPLGMDPALAFGRVREVHEQLLRAHPSATIRCIGMSEDFDTAIEFGATHIRVGSAILGHRTVA